MKKLILMLLVLFLCGCSVKDEDGNLSASQIVYDFEITLSTQQNTFNVSELANANPFSYLLEVQYVGQKDYIEVGHGDPLGMIFILDSAGEMVLPVGRTDELHISSFEPGTTFSVIWDGSLERKLLGPLEEGEYTVMSWVNFNLSNSGEEVDIYLELPLTIK
jgi:hypothetical protein